ncbi:unnamed protein product [Penicillium camemberti]|uniref:Str. FM013 n=1 Tax=Penicillium camemberti (strain FM 013) TaxID=1429867 RepID=A0A0G4PK28_PENC3|nr:unnamed protein product [Penicillium camemberti]
MAFFERTPPTRMSPGFPLSDADVEELTAVLPEIIKNIVEERRWDRKVEN